MSTKITIKKAKIKSGLFISVEYNEDTETGSNKVTKSCTAPVHQDMIQAFKNLDKHLGALCEQYESPKGKLAACKCAGFSIGGSIDSEGITLIGTRELSTERLVHLTSPFIRWTNDDYLQLSNLELAHAACEKEILAYLIDGKIRPEAQQKLEFADSERDELG